MNTTSIGIIIQIVQFGDTSVIAKILTPDHGVLSFIYKGVRKKNKTAIAHLLFPGSLVSIDYKLNPHKDLHFALKTSIAHPYFISQDSVIKNCIMIFIIEALKNFVIEGDDNKALFEIYLKAIDIMHQESESGCANLPIFVLLQMSENAGYKIINNYSIDKPVLDLDQGQFIPSHHPDIKAPSHLIHLSFFLNDNPWEMIKKHPMNKEDRKLILELYILFLKTHHSSFQNFKSLDILSMVIG